MLVGSLTHWHPNEEDMLGKLYSLGKNGNILVLKKGLIGTGVYYMGEPEKYQFNSKKNGIGENLFI